MLSLFMPWGALHAAEPKTGEAKRIDLGEKVTLEVVYLPPGEFMMGSTPEEKKWATLQRTSEEYTRVMVK